MLKYDGHSSSKTTEVYTQVRSHSLAKNIALLMS